MSTNVLIADDHFPVRLGMEIIVRETLGMAVKVDFAMSGYQILENVANKQYDLLISDINMPNCDIRLVITQVLQQQPHLKILVVSVNSKEIYAPLLLKLGVYGYVCKTDEDQELRKAIRNASLGKKYLFNEYVLDASENALSKISSNPFNALSKREFEVVTLLLKGFSIIDIGNTLQLSPSTASTYKMRIFQKLKINSVLMLSVLAKKFSVFDDDISLY